MVRYIFVKEKIMENIQTSFLEDYNIKLENFEGPLELLYSLIKKSKMSIEEIKLADITSQYLEYMKNVSELDLEQASSFIEWAAILLEIKSQKLLPVENDELPEIDLEMLAKLKIQEYALIKEASYEIAVMENNDHFYKSPDKSANNARIILTEFNMDKLIEAFSHLLVKSSIKAVEKIEEKEVVNDRWTVAEKMNSVRNALISSKTIKFKSLFDDNYSKSEVITVFLALLELLKQQVAYVDQENVTDDITIHYVDNTDIVSELQTDEIENQYN